MFKVNFSLKSKINAKALMIIKLGDDVGNNKGGALLEKVDKDIFLDEVPVDIWILSRRQPRFISSAAAGYYSKFGVFSRQIWEGLLSKCFWKELFLFLGIFVFNKKFTYFLCVFTFVNYYSTQDKVRRSSPPAECVLILHKGLESMNTDLHSKLWNVTQDSTSVFSYS